MAGFLLYGSLGGADKYFSRLVAGRTGPCAAAGHKGRSALAQATHQSRASGGRQAAGFDCLI